jgi:ankyrin repeat protein
MILDEQLPLNPDDSYDSEDTFSWSKTNVMEKPTTMIVECLLEAGASVNSQTDSGDTPVHLSIMDDYFEAASQMLNKDFNPNIQNCHGTTCLMLVVNKDQEIVQRLLDIGADPSIKDTEGNTALHHFCMYYTDEF